MDFKTNRSYRHWNPKKHLYNCNFVSFFQPSKVRCYHLSAYLQKDDDEKYKQIRTENEAETVEERGREFFMQEAVRALAEGNTELSISKYLMASRSDPTSPEPYSQLSALYFSSENYRLSIDNALKALEADLNLRRSNKFRNKHLTTMEISNENLRLSHSYLKLGKSLEAHKHAREALMRYDTRSARDLIFEIESKFFQAEVVRDSELSIQNDKFLQHHISNAPLMVRETTSNGRGLFATRNIKQGEIVYKETPITCSPDLDNIPQTLCTHCLRTLEDIEWAFSSERIEEMSKQLEPGQLEAFHNDIASSLDVPPLHAIQDYDGNFFCSPNCRDEAHTTWLKPIDGVVKPQSLDHRVLFPSHYALEYNFQEAEEEGMFALMKELTSIELVSRLVGVIYTNPVEAEYLHRLAHLKFTPTPLLLDHQKLQLNTLRKVFPQFKETWLTNEGYYKLKSIVELNSFSIETQALRIELGESSTPPSTDDKPPNEAEDGTAQQLGLNVLMREGVGVNGHGLFRLGSMMNHSCDPNIGLSHPQITSNSSWVALRDIFIGEELLDSYVELDSGQPMSREERRQILHDSYYFWCNCSLCASGK